MITRLKLKKILAGLPTGIQDCQIVLRQGMIAGFMGSVHSCQHLIREGKAP